MQKQSFILLSLPW